MTETTNYRKVLYELKISPETAKTAELIFAKVPQAGDVLGSPVVSLAKKQRVIEKIFPKEIHNFMKILCKYHKTEDAQEILRTYQDYYNEQQGILNAQLSYVVKPTEIQLDNIRSFLCKKFRASDIAFRLQEQKDLIGGFVIRVNDQEIDYSLQGRINVLKQNMSGR